MAVAGNDDGVALTAKDDGVAEAANYGGVAVAAKDDVVAVAAKDRGVAEAAKDDGVAVAAYFSICSRVSGASYCVCGVMLLWQGWKLAFAAGCQRQAVVSGFETDRLGNGSRMGMGLEV